MARVASGDEAAFGALYDGFSRSLYGLGLRMLGDPARSEELVQETMLKVWRGADSFDLQKGAVSSWIFTVARRTGLDMVRKLARTPRSLEPVPDTSDTADEDRQEWRHWEIGRLLGTLPDEQRIAVEMFVIEGYTHSEISERSGVALGTVKTRIYTGLRRLREDLERQGLVEAGEQ